MAQKYPLIPVSRTLIDRTIKYLDDAAQLYDSIPGQRAVCRAWCLRQLIDQLNRRKQSTTDSHP